MVYQYVVTLKNRNRKYIDRLSFFITGLSVLFFIRQQFTGPKNSYIFLAASAIAVISIAWNYVEARKKKTIANYRFALLAVGLCWFVMPYLQWIGIPILILSAIEKQAKFDLEIGFSDDEVVMNTLFKRKFKWTEFSNIILRDDILTLDWKNNKLLQRETVDEEGDAEEDEFNDYCRNQLQKAGSMLID